MSRPPPDPATRIGRILITLYRGWPVGLAIISTAWATYGWLQMQFEARVEGICQPVIEAAVSASSQTLTKAFHKELQANFNHQQRLEIRLQTSHDALQRMYWFYVGDIAADRARSRRHRELAAAKARLAFEEQIRKGKSVQDALSNVLAKPP